MPDDVVVATAELALLTESFARRGKNIGKLTPVIAEMLVTAVHDVFEAEGPGWQKHAASTIAKRRGKSDYKLLQNTTNLISNIHPEHGPDWAMAGTNVPYVRFHLAGGPIIPKRNPFEVRDSIADDVVDLMLSHLVAE